MHPTPQSAQVERGKAYPFILNTACGLDNFVYFDGSFWDVLETHYAPVSPRTPVTDRPLQPGTITLTEDDHALFEFDNGSILFARHLGPKVLPGMCG